MSSRPFGPFVRLNCVNARHIHLCVGLHVYYYKHLHFFSVQAAGVIRTVQIDHLLTSKLSS
jgi:hypothetical protein